MACNLALDNDRWKQHTPSTGAMQRRTQSHRRCFMSIRARIVRLGMLGAVAFGAAYAVRVQNIGTGQNAAAVPLPPDAPDSVVLSAMGVTNGPRLVLYVFVASKCSQCQHRDTRDAIRQLHSGVLSANSPRYHSASVVAVVLDSDISEGMAYLQSIGLERFSEISVGNAWLNEFVGGMVWRQHLTEPAVPQVVIVERTVDATSNPLSIDLSRDSVVAVIVGRNALVKWVQQGMTTAGAEGLSREREVASSESATQP